MESQDNLSKFIITVKDEDGDPLPGVYLKLIDYNGNKKRDGLLKY